MISLVFSFDLKLIDAMHLIKFFKMMRRLVMSGRLLLTALQPYNYAILLNFTC